MSQYYRLDRTLVLLFAFIVSCHIYGADDNLLSKKRPYEMVWANRTEDAFPPFIDFESDMKWKVETRDAEASFARSQEQQIWGKYVGKLTFRVSGNDPEIIIKPERKLPVKEAFDTISCWIYGWRASFNAGPSSGMEKLEALFEKDGETIALPLLAFGRRLSWQYWGMSHFSLSKAQCSELAGSNLYFVGIRITSLNNKQPESIYFDNLALYKGTSELPPAKPHPKRGIAMFPGQSEGLNTGAGKLPFPTRSDTILPDSAAPGSKNKLEAVEDAFFLSYQGSDGSLMFRYTPRSGKWSDIEARWNDGKWFQPLENGGVLMTDGKVRDPFVAVGNGIAGKAVHEGTKIENDTLVSKWSFTDGNKKSDVTFSMRMKGKTLILDTVALGNQCSSVNFGNLKGLPDLKIVELPYGGFGRRPGPGIVASKTPEASLFISGHIDWYRTNASTLWGKATVKDDKAWFNGGSNYLHKTDGTLNDCYERFFITVSPKFEEHLPNIPNPPSPWKSLVGSHIFLDKGPHPNLDVDKKFYYQFWRYGVRKFFLTDHEPMWRSANTVASTSFREECCPFKGGDERAIQLSEYLQNDLGFLYGYYDDYPDLAPINKYWDINSVMRMPDNNLLPAYIRCYAPKAHFMVEAAEKITAVIKNKLKLKAVYSDCITAWPPWNCTDYDARIPGAGTFAATYYLWGELMLDQQRILNGPVISEGGHHYYYSGLNAGNYATDDRYDLMTRPWLVDFDLRKIHDLQCNYGLIQSVERKYFRDISPNSHPDSIDGVTDRLRAGTMAFGHAGRFNFNSLRVNLRTYFTLQQLQSRYTLSSVESIFYADQEGNLHETSEAVFNEAAARSQLAIRYKDGINVAVNGNQSDDMKIAWRGKNIVLPPNGYQAWTDDGEIEVFSALKDGYRCDYVVSPEYIFIDGRDKKFQTFPKAASPGLAVCRKINNTEWEVIPMDGTVCGFDINAASARAMNYDNKEIGKAEIFRYNGLTYIVPVKNAFSYILTKGDLPAENSSMAEWMRWINPSCETAEPERYGFKKVASTVPVTQDELRNAVKGKIHYRGITIDNVKCELNDIPAGMLKKAMGDDLRECWSDETSVELPAASLKTLALENSIKLSCTGRIKSFKITDVWLEVKLADGRTVSSYQISVPTSYPQAWRMILKGVTHKPETIDLPLLFENGK